MRPNFYQSAFNFSADDLKQAGMKIALQSAEEKEESWGDKCYELLKEFVRIHRQEFLAEEFRRWSQGRITAPPSDRAYGPVILRAAKNDLIKRMGHGTVKNAKAHACFSTIWKSNSQ